MLGLQDDINDIELKQRWRLYWIETLFELAHLAFQKKHWKGTADVAQCLSAYFDDLGLYTGLVKALEIGNISQEELDMATPFHNLAVFYDIEQRELDAVLQDPEWLEIVTTAKIFWDYLVKNLSVSREVTLIKNLEKKIPNHLLK